MKVTNIGSPKIIMSNPGSKFNYFGWPSAARLQNGKIAVVASGFRMRHICPYGKLVIAYSEDDGETYTAPAPVIDTVLDDRDGGILAFGESNVIVTSFNNRAQYQRKFQNEFDKLYLDSITEEEDEKAIGSNFRISNDCGVTFGEIFKSPISSPHGPAVLNDGSLIWVGRTFNPMNVEKLEDERIKAYTMKLDGTMEFVGEIEGIQFNGAGTLSCEPHAIVLDDGTILVHIRVQNDIHQATLYTLFQSESKDNGKTWSKPRQILSDCGGAPGHLFKHSSGMLICTYGFRGEPFLSKPCGIKAMFSKDNGKTWDTGHWLYQNYISHDLGYPTTVELPDQSMITVFYAIPEEGSPCVIMQQKWKMEADI